MLVALKDKLINVLRSLWINRDLKFKKAMISDKENYFNLGTLKRDGSYVDTPVWFAKGSSGDAFYVLANVNSGKVKRLRNFDSTRIAICDWKGRLKGEWELASAELVTESVDMIRLFRSKYGLQFYVFEFFSWLSGKRKERQMILVTPQEQ